MSVSTEIRNKVFSITGMEPVCDSSSRTVNEHIRSMLDNLWLTKSDQLMPLYWRIYGGSVSGSTWTEDSYKSLFHDIRELLAGNERPPVKGVEFLPDALRLDLNEILDKHDSFNDELADAVDSMVAKATKVYSPTIVALLEAVIGKATIGLLEEYLDGKIGDAIDKLS